MASTTHKNDISTYDTNVLILINGLFRRRPDARFPVKLGMLHNVEWGGHRLHYLQTFGILESYGVHICKLKELERLLALPDQDSVAEVDVCVCQLSNCCGTAIKCKHCESICINFGVNPDAWFYNLNTGQSGSPFPLQMKVASNSPIDTSKISCKHGQACTYLKAGNCRFGHSKKVVLDKDELFKKISEIEETGKASEPVLASSSDSPNVTPDKKVVPGDRRKKPCRYGDNCKFKLTGTCNFSHA